MPSRELGQSLLCLKSASDVYRSFLDWSGWLTGDVLPFIRAVCIPDFLAYDKADVLDSDRIRFIELCATSEALFASEYKVAPLLRDTELQKALQASTHGTALAAFYSHRRSKEDIADARAALCAFVARTECHIERVQDLMEELSAASGSDMARQLQ